VGGYAKLFLNQGLFNTTKLYFFNLILQTHTNMLELAISTIGIAAIIYIAMTAIKEFKESNAKLIGLVDSQQSISRELLRFIDKNIHERVIYTTPELGYTSKIEETKEEIGDDGEESFEVTVEKLMEQNKEYHNEDKNNQEEGG
jgi:hypothetical protein